METQTKQLKTCAITGRRPDGFPFAYGDNPATHTYRERLKSAIVHLIEKEQVTCFITGGALGVDLDAAEIILQLQEKYPFLTHIFALPYENQGGRYALKDKIRHEKVQRASQTVVLAERYSPWCMQQRNEYMVDNADLVAAFFCGENAGGTYNTVRYAKQKNKLVLAFNLNDHASEWLPIALFRPSKQLTLL